MTTRLNAVQEVLETCEDVISEASYLTMRRMERSLKGSSKREPKLKRVFVVFNSHNVPIFVSSNENIASKLCTKIGGQIVSCLQVSNHKIADEIINADKTSNEFSYLENPQF